MGSTTKQVNTTPNDIRGLREGVVNYLMGGGQQSGSQGGWSGGGGGGGTNSSPWLKRPGNQTAAGANGSPQAGGYGTPDGFQGGNAQGQPQTGGFNYGNAQGGPGPAGGSPFDKMFAQMPQQWQPMSVDRAAAYNPQQINAPQFGGVPDVNAQQIGQMPQIQSPGQGMQVGDPGQGQNVTGTNIDINSILTQLGVDPTRGQIRDVNASQVGPQSTQSVDQLGGQNSAFFLNMMRQMQPAFDQRRQMAIAQAKESAGNLTGTGYANAVGNTLNRSLGEEQAQLANYAAQGLQTEVGRQMGLAGINNQAGMANAANNLQGQLANQGADVNFLNMLNQRGATAAGLGMQAALANQGNNMQAQLANQGNAQAFAQLGQQAQMANQNNMFNYSQLGQQAQLANQNQAWNVAQANQGANLQAAIANQNAGMNVGQMNQNAQMQALLANQNAGLQSGLQNQQLNQQANNLVAQLNASGQMQQLQQAAQMGDANAQRFMQMLLGMTTTGVAPNSVVPTGWGQALQGISQGAGTGLGLWAGSKLKG